MSTQERLDATASAVDDFEDFLRGRAADREAKRSEQAARALGALEEFASDMLGAGDRETKASAGSRRSGDVGPPTRRRGKRGQGEARAEGKEPVAGSDGDLGPYEKPTSPYPRRAYAAYPQKHSPRSGSPRLVAASRARKK
jgi:hypothetical protein